MKKAEIAVIAVLVLGGVAGRFYLAEPADGAHGGSCPEKLSRFPHAVDSLDPDAKAALCSQLDGEQAQFSAALDRATAELKASLPRNLADDEAFVSQHAQMNVLTSPEKYGAVPPTQSLAACLSDGDEGRIQACAANAKRRRVSAATH